MSQPPLLFQPSQADVRRFFCAVYAKAQMNQALEAIETIASLWIDEHPEYQEALSDVNASLLQLSEADTQSDGAAARADGATSNPFLHLAMHLTISEQCSIDQPRGIRQAVELLTARRDSLHDAHHEVMDCLGEMIWQSQRSGRPADGEGYAACVQRRATKD